MSTETESRFEHNGASLYCKTWTPTGTTKAKLIMVHGFSEHINRYDEFFKTIASKGIQVLAWDQRGWGYSVTKPSQKGLTGPTTKVLDDAAAFIKDKLPSDVPVFVMGHSMGGGEILTMMGDSQYKDLVEQVRGWILECPFVAFTPGQEPSSIKVALGRFAGRMLPNFQLKHIVPPEFLSRDPAVVKSVRDDPLCHDTGTLEGLAATLDRTMVLAAGNVKVGKHVKSVLLAHGSDDKVCSHDAAMEWLKKQDIEDKTAKSYKGGYHQLHTDLCKEEFGNDLVDWILKRSDASAAADAPVAAEAKDSKPSPSESKL